MRGPSFVLAAAGGDEQVDLTNLSEVWDLLGTTVADLGRGFVADLPIYVIALVVYVAGLALVRLAIRATQRGLKRSTLDTTLEKLTLVFTRVILMTVLVILSLSVAGFEVGAALAALGLLGLAFAFAFQNILENFIAGILILIRRPFRIGDQVVANGYEGTVIDVNMRITKLKTYEGVSVLLPNADVFRNPLVNLTEQKVRRTSVMIGIDYRDDHHAAGEIIRAAVAGVDGVLDDPAPDVLLTALGASSVDFEVRFWTLADIGSVRNAQDGVLRVAKSAVEDAGMTIPWPIRTLEPGSALRVLTSHEA